MAYNDTPLAAQRKNDSQLLIRENFTILQNYLQQDHSPINGSGKHVQVTLPMGPIPVTGAGEIALYSRDIGGGVPNLFLAPQNGAAPVNMMASMQVNTNGWARLPSGLLLKWGQTNGNGDTTINYPVAAGIPVFTTVLSAQVSPFLVSAIDEDFAVRISRYTVVASLSVYVSRRTGAGAHNGTFTYLVIGI